MSEQLYFAADAALIDRLGRELVGKQETALIELIKNSFDADATKVTVTFGTDAVEITDDGSGMTRDELVNGFLRLASNLKVVEPRSRKFKRSRAGRKGIGRFATQRLGRTLTLRTKTEDSVTGLELKVDWTKFVPNTNLSEVPVTLSVVEDSGHGTTLVIGGLRDYWSDTQIKRSWRGVVGLQQPFPVREISAKPNRDPGFSVDFKRGASGFTSDAVVIADLQSEILNHLHALIEFRVDHEGQAEWRLTRNKFGADRDWRPIHHADREGVTSPAYEHLRDVAMKAFYFILDPLLLPSLVFTRVRDVLRSQGGIRLYRNGFRVVPYGGYGDDWLELDETSSQRGQTLSPVRNLNFFGVVEVNDPDGEHFEESTSREGLVETPAFDELKALASSVIISAVQVIAADRGRKPRAGGSSTRVLPVPTRLIEQLRKVEETARQIAISGSNETPTEPGATAAPLQLAELAKQGAELIEAREAELADESTILRLLATLGLTAAEFSHETGMTFEAVRMAFTQIFQVARDALPDNADFAENVDRASGMLNRLDALTSYLNSIASARAVRQLGAVSVAREVERFAKGMSPQAQKQEVQLSFSTPEFDPLFTKPMHAADIATILLNFYSNSLKAMFRSGARRNIHIEAGQEGTEVFLRFADTGDGIAEDIRSKVFELFFTTRTAGPATSPPHEQVTGTGLGLWIVQQIVSKVGGSVDVVESPEGYSTCLEVRLPSEDE